MQIISWDRVAVDKGITVRKCIFISLSAIQGGAIFSNYSAKHSVYYNAFYLCNATGDAGSRGGAFHIKLGYVTIKLCCANTCNGNYCSDMITWTPTEVDWKYISSYNAEGAGHSLYCSASSKVSLRHANVTHSFISTKPSRFAAGINTAYNVDCKPSFVNIISCRGSSGLIAIYSCRSHSYEVSHINTYNNSNFESFVLVIDSKNSNFDFVDCTLLEKGVSYIINTESSDNDIAFKNCYFSEIQKSDQYSIESCIATSKSLTELFKYNSCYAGIKYLRCTKSCSKKYFMQNIILHIIIIET